MARRARRGGCSPVSRRDGRGRRGGRRRARRRSARRSEASPRETATALSEQSLQARPADVAHRQVEDAVDLVGVVDRDHVRMRRARLRAATPAGTAPGSPRRAQARVRSPSVRPCARAVHGSPGTRCPSRRGRAPTRSCSRRTSRRRQDSLGLNTSASDSRRRRSFSIRCSASKGSSFFRSSHMSFASSTRVCIGSSAHTACISSSCVQSAGAPPAAAFRSAM